MKRIRTLIAALLLVSAFCLTACGDKSSTTQPDSKPTDVSESIDVSQTESSEESTEESTEESFEAPAQEEDVFLINWSGIDIALPATFEQRFTFPVGVYKGSTEHNPDVTFVLTKDSDYRLENPDATYTAADVQEILKDRVFTDISSYYPTGEEDYEVKVDSEADIEAVGLPFVLKKGTTHCGIGSLDDTLLHYVGCYGVTDVPMYEEKDVPFAWIAYTTESSDEALNEIEDLIRNVTAEAKYCE